MKKGSKKEIVKEKSVTKKTSNKKHYIAEKKNTKAKKEKRENIFKRIGKYFKGVFKELKRIRWTEKKELGKYTVCTLLFVLFFGLYFYAIDWLVLLVRGLDN